MLRKIKKFFRASTLANPDAELLSAFFAARSSAGVNVTEATAYNYSAVFACIRLLSETIASLPLHLYKRGPGGSKTRAVDHPLYRILHTAPNPQHTSFRWRSLSQGHLASGGNAYSQIVREKSGRITQLWPLIPDKVRIEKHGGELFYIYDNKHTLDSSDVLHIPGFGFDGVVGYSPIRLAREAIGLGLAAEEFGSRFFSNGANPGGIIEYPGKMTDESYKRFKDSIHDAYQGLGNSKKLMILEQGLKYQQVTIPPNDAQFLETRKFQVSEICRIFRVPPHLIGDLEKATFSNIEEQSIEFVVHTIRPWLVLWEQELTRALLSEAEQQLYFFEFKIDGLLRGNIANRYAAYAVGRQNGWLSANDIRNLENMNPIKDGDVYLVPLNMVPAGEVSSRKDGQRSIENRASITKEERSRRSVTERNRIREVYKRLFQDASERVVNREVIAITRAVKKHLTERNSQGFADWLVEFYNAMPGHIERAFLPVLTSYADQVYGAVKNEVGDIDRTETDSFVRDYLAGFVARHIGSSRGQLLKMVKENDPSVLVDDILLRMDEWADTRPGKIAEDESVRAGSAITKSLYVAAGVTTLRWVAQGSKSCPYCQELDGRTVGITGAFVESGEAFEPEGANGAMNISGPKAHPPLHAGCVCAIVAG